MSYSKKDFEKMGRAVAAVYRERGIDMNTSIAKLALEKGLNRHQMQRVVEYANHDCFATERHRRISQAKEATGKDKQDLYITFDVADPRKVLAKTSGMLEPKTASEHFPVVQIPKEYSSEAPRDLRLNTSFPFPSVVKTAADHQAARDADEEA